MADLRRIGPPFGRRASDVKGGWWQTWAVLRVVLIVGAAVAAVWLVYQLRDVLLLLVLCVFFAYLLAPLVAIVNRPFHVGAVERRLSRAASIGVVYLVLFGVLTLTFAWLVPRFSQQVTQIAAQAPSYVTAVEGGGQQVTAKLDRLGLPANAREAMNRTLATLVATVEATARRSLSAAVAVFGYLPWLVLIPILAFFLLKDGEAFSEAAAVCGRPPGGEREQSGVATRRDENGLASPWPPARMCSARDLEPGTRTRDQGPGTRD